MNTLCQEEIKIKSKKWNEKLSMKYAVFCPVFISVLLFACEMLGIMNDDLSSVTILKVMSVFISYAPSTLIASIAWACVQQFIMGIPAGIDKSQIIFLLVTYITYAVFYVVYLSQNKPEGFLLWFLVGLTFYSAKKLWQSLEEDVRHSKPCASG